jgi:hypothetical protein
MIVGAATTTAPSAIRNIRDPGSRDRRRATADSCGSIQVTHFVMSQSSVCRTSINDRRVRHVSNVATHASARLMYASQSLSNHARVRGDSSGRSNCTRNAPRSI